MGFGWLPGVFWPMPPSLDFGSFPGSLANLADFGSLVAIDSQGQDAKDCGSASDPHKVTSFKSLRPYITVESHRITQTLASHHVPTWHVPFLLPTSGSQGKCLAVWLAASKGAAGCKGVGSWTSKSCWPKNMNDEKTEHTVVVERLWRELSPQPSPALFLLQVEDDPQAYQDLNSVNRGEMFKTTIRSPDTHVPSPLF